MNNNDQSGAISTAPALPNLGPQRDVKESVERFVRCFEDEIQAIATAELCNSRNKYRSLLLCCLIDTVSNIVEMPNVTSPGDQRGLDKKKFLMAVERYGNWPDCTRVCRPFLENLIELIKDSEFDPVRRFVAALTPWPGQRHSATVLVAEVDPYFSALAAVWPKSDDGVCKPVQLNGRKVHPESLQHHCLLYDCRNKLSHELRALVSESEHPLGYDRPYYHHTRDWILECEYWQVMQPPGFLVRMTKDILVGLGNYCIENHVEPFSRLFPERYWYERPY